MNPVRLLQTSTALLLWTIVGSYVHAESWTPRLLNAIQNQTLNELVQPLSEDLRRAIQDEQASDETVIELSAAYRFAVFFSRTPLSDDLDKACLSWLVQQPRLMQTLCLALGSTERPDAVLSVFRALYRTDRETMPDWADLVTALIVVWDEPRRESSDDPAARGDWAVQLYAYYTRNNRRLRYDLRSMPWNLQIYVVDLVISREEMIWAWDRYGQRGDVGGFYFDVPYDTAAFYQGEDKKIDALAYTLDNLQKHGGICTDQAYYATQIGRLIGVPTVTIIGQGGAGQVAHAWVGYLARQGKKVVWDLTSGRYPEQMYWTGQVENPQTRQNISEAETSLLGELQNTTRDQRLQALALMRALDLFEPARQVDVLLRSLNLCPADREAWLKLGELGSAGVLTDQQTSQVMETVRQFAARPYADLAYEVYRRIISGKSNLQQINLLDQLAKVFGQRPDLVARIRIEQGKNYKSLKQIDRALSSWGEVLTRHLYAGPIVLEALELTDQTLRERGQGRELLAVYERVFNNIPKPTPSAFAAFTPFCQIGVKYADLLDEAGNRSEAQKVRQQVGVFDKSIQITMPAR